MLCELCFICRCQTVVKHLCANKLQRSSCLFMRNVAVALVERRRVEEKQRVASGLETESYKYLEEYFEYSELGRK